MKRNFYLFLGLMCSLLSSCNFNVHKTYTYTISGTVYSDRVRMEPMHLSLDILDYKYSDYTYGASYDDNVYTIKTDENGHFSLTLKSSKVYTEVQTSCYYDFKGDSVLRGDAVREHFYSDEDTCWHTSCYFYVGAKDDDIDQLENMVIYMNEYPCLTVEPNSFTRKQTIQVHSDVGMTQLSTYWLEPLSRNEYHRYDPVYKFSYYGRSDWGVPFNKTLDLELNIPDSVPAGYYRLRLFGDGGFLGINAEPDCIVELIDE